MIFSKTISNFPAGVLPASNLIIAITPAEIGSAPPARMHVRRRSLPSPALLAQVTVFPAASAAVPGTTPDGSIRKLPRGTISHCNAATGFSARGLKTNRIMLADPRSTDVGVTSTCWAEALRANQSKNKDTRPMELIYAITGRVGLCLVVAGNAIREPGMIGGPGSRFVRVGFGQGRKLEFLQQPLHLPPHPT